MSIPKQLRVLVLLLILAFAAFYTAGQQQASTNWLESLDVIVYPVNADGLPEIDHYISGLDRSDFLPVERFFLRQSEKYDLGLTNPVSVSFGKVLSLPPPAPEPGASRLKFMLWSLQFRYWAWKTAPDEVSNFRRVRIYVLYRKASPGLRLAHSYATSKGLLGYVNAFASKDQNSQNNVVIAHELLHTVGATDKYEADGEPSFPDGYAEPNERRFPQRWAEIMAGRIPLGPGKSKMPESLRYCEIGPMTAAEIRWLR